MSGLAVTSLPVSSIRPGDNDRTTFVGIDELAGSIRESGLAQPITVRPAGDGSYEIVAGERRFRAVSSLGLETIDAIIRPLSDREASDIMLTENMGRVDLDPVSEGDAFAKRIDALGYSVEDLAAVAGVPVSRVRARVRCSRDLNHNAKQDYAVGLLNHQQAFELCSIAKDRQDTLLRAMRAEGFSTTQWRKLLSKVREAQALDSQSGLFDSEGFSLQVEEYVVEARKARRPGRRETDEMIAALLAALPAGHDDLRARADALLARCEEAA